jgi:hypothetical protein
MAKNKVRVKPRDQKPFTRYKANRCSIAKAAKREYGIPLSVQGDIARKRTGLFGLFTLSASTWKVDSTGQNVQGTHDAGERVGYATVTLTGPPLKTLAEQAQEAREAVAGRKQVRAARRARAKEQAAQQARAKAAERPDPRQQARAAVREQPRAAERPRSAEDERAARTRARIQEAEARERLSATQLRARTPREQPVPQPRAAAQPRPAERQPARAPQARVPREQPRAIEPPRTGLQWLLRNPFARPEPEAEPVRTRRTA